MKASNKNNPFKTPEGYFENFTDGLMDKLNEEKFNLPKEDGFVVPEHYLEGLHKNIQEKLNSEETKVVQLNPYRKYYLTAASIAAIILIFFGFNWNTPGEITFEDLASTDIENYFESNELGLTTYEIAELLPVDELEINDILENQFNEENVIDYLNDNIDDIEDLNLEDYE
ncbi:hypothetical protein FEE95_17545 [Maribacter algarum]|uniref:Uncharacterized protein n=1 Tax=Maribacter algarum (ex Zhang et al. 2020) TaxID=2578118 RepID=A0A5S3Q9I0_9FLAO|nr:hypothetical protein [Maribacter algarum]TMM53703.1 hypothetical protein FEE95_17545 [Maribacter algarum]